MYEEELIFGPLTLKQFLCLACGIIIAYVAYSSLSSGSADLTIFIVGIVIALMLIHLKPKKIAVADLEKYLESKKGFLGSDAYIRMLQKKHAQVLSQINAQKARGRSIDPQFTEAEQVLASLIQKQNL